MTPPTLQKRARKTESFENPSSMSTKKTTASIFGDGMPKDAATTPALTPAPATSDLSDATATLKRKVTDPQMKIITVAPMYDLTVIVGTPEHVHGQKAYRISKGSLRNVSPIWSKMLNGDWKESEMSEISFPDDDCDAFLTVLRIAHFQVSELPEAMSVEQLVDLAILTDKYELHNAVSMGAGMKKWIDRHHNSGTAWPAGCKVQDFAIITCALRMQGDYQYLTSRLAMDAHVGEAGEFYILDDKQNKVTLRYDMPPNITGEIDRIRSEVLSAWIATCIVAVIETFKAPLPPCGRKMCRAMKSGVLLHALHAANLYPSPPSTEFLRGSILSYWNHVGKIGVEHKNYAPCNIHRGVRRARSSGHDSDCSFEKCFGDFGIVTDARATLQQYAHKDLWKEWQANSTV